MTTQPHNPYGHAPAADSRYGLSGTEPSPNAPHPTGRLPAGPPLANIGARLGARLLDLVIWYVGYFLTALPLMLWIDSGGGATAQTLLLTWLLASFILYFPFTIWRYGSTLGKRVCNVRVVRSQSAQPVGFWRAAGRETFVFVAAVIPVLGLLNPLWCCWDKPLQQCLHDKVVDTVALTRRQ
ncbi:RDD family protein [Streptomyces californicus]|uniref:RDD family protein n=1 Tax=Streptomyces californicus TaxID=67351 RepID=UPI00296FC64C|nr:RDD family protein [Streptomyces californicus]MDW4912571.1 RDD family protein [Streptomyces californicus]